MLAMQGIFVRDTLGLVLGKCCKVRHSVTNPYKQLRFTVGNITVAYLGAEVLIK